MPQEFWIVVTQYDMSPFDVFEDHPARGPLVHESYLLTKEQAEERAKSLTRYGWVKIFRVESKEGTS